MTNRKRLIGILLAVLILASTAAALAAVMIPSAEELLVQAIETSETITDGHAVAEFSVETPEMSGSGTLEVWGQLDVGPNGEPALRVEVLSADEAELVGATAVSDGTQFWLYHPAENRVLVGTFAELEEKMADYAATQDFSQFEHPEEMDDFDPDALDIPETPEEAVAKMLEYFTASRTETANIGANRVYTVRLVPIPEQMPEEVRAAGGYLNVFVRGLDSAFVGLEYAEGALGSGRALATTLELNQGIDPAVFTFDIPAGAEVVTLDDLEALMPAADADFTSAAEFTVLSPALLPDGAELQETAVVRGAVVERYSLDEGEFYIAQGPLGAADGLFGNDNGENVGIRGTEALLYTDVEGGRVLLTWQEGDVTYWVGGSLSAEMATRIAESLQ